jgi:hypothetical protein
MIIVFDLSGVYFNNGKSEALDVLNKKFGIEIEKIDYYFYGGSAKKKYRISIQSDKDL